jgi:hypothetical protein
MILKWYGRFEVFFGGIKLLFYLVIVAFLVAINRGGEPLLYMNHRTWVEMKF